MVKISTLTLTDKQQGKQMCNVLLISLKRRKTNYMYLSNNSFLRFDLKIGNETACLISQGSWFHNWATECLIHFCRIFVFAKGMK